MSDSAPLPPAEKIVYEHIDPIERIRYELTLPVQSQFIRSDVKLLLDEIDRLRERLKPVTPMEGDAV